MNAECKLMNERGKVIAMGSQDQMTRHLKHHVEDGMYAIEGPGIDMTYYRVNGVVYPCGGRQDGEKMLPRSLEECRQVFDECRKTVTEKMADASANGPLNVLFGSDEFTCDFCGRRGLACKCDHEKWRARG